KATMQSRLARPFDLHSLALATMTLLEAAVVPEYANECWDALHKVEEILDRSAKRNAGAAEFVDVRTTPGCDTKIRIFLEGRRIKAQESQLQDPNLNKSSSSTAPMGPNEQRSLQHLADLAVGAEDSVAASANASTPPPALPSTENTTSPNL